VVIAITLTPVRH